MDLDKTATLRAWLRYIDPPSYGSVVERSDEELFGGHMDDESNVYLLVASHVQITRAEARVRAADHQRLNAVLVSLVTKGRICQNIGKHDGIVYSIPE
jgi:hypothetical protein